jgi:hypothetical protein
MIIISISLFNSLIEYPILLSGILPLVLYFLLFKSIVKMGTKSLIKLSDGYHVKTQPIDKEEFIELSNKAKDYLIEWESEIYVLENNTIVYKSEFNKRIFYGWFSSLADMKKTIEDAPNRKFTRHFFEGYNPYQKHFPEKTKELIKELLNDLGLDCENITINNKLIPKIDRAISYQDDPQIFMINHIIHIAAVLGEIFLIENKDAEWYMERDSDGETFLPMIKVNRGIDKMGTIDFVHWLYGDIMHFADIYNVLESSYLSLNDFSTKNLLTPERDSNGKIRVVNGKIVKD